MNKIKIGEKEFEAPFRYYEKTARVLDADGAEVYEFGKMPLTLIGQALADALNQSALTARVEELEEGRMSDSREIVCIQQTCLKLLDENHLLRQNLGIAILKSARHQVFDVYCHYEDRCNYDAADYYSDGCDFLTKFLKNTFGDSVLKDSF